MAENVSAVLSDLIAAMGAGVDCHVGARCIAYMGTFPRIVFVPQQGRYATPTRGGNGTPGTGRIAERAVSVRANIWEEDVAAAEARIVSLARALHSLAGPVGYRMVSEEWDEGDAVTDKGQVVDVIFEVNLDVTRGTQAHTRLTGMPTTASVE